MKGIFVSFEVIFSVLTDEWILFTVVLCPSPTMIKINGDAKHASTLLYKAMTELLLTQQIEDYRLLNKQLHASQ
jgi:hypothetical protein